MDRFLSKIRDIGHYLLLCPGRLWQLFKGAKWYYKIVLVSELLVICFFLLLLSIGLNLFNLFGDIPSIAEIENSAQSEASVLYSADGKVMGKFFSENRSPVKFEEISQETVNTLICTEDVRFYEHSGIDFKGLFSALKDAMKGKARGASTITQQLAKNLFKMRTDNLRKGALSDVKGVGMFINKMKEWITAIRIESRYDKNTILTMYLNTVDFGCNSFGIRTAAKTYFGTEPQRLNYEQSAVLVGLLKATSYYNPKINPKNALKRRNVVLGNLLQSSYIDSMEYKRMCNEPIRLDFDVEKNYDGWALYFRGAVADYLSQWCKDGRHNLYTDGLKIYTTLDSTMQSYAEHSVWKQMKEVQRRFDNHWGNNNPWQDARHREIPNFVWNVAKHSDCYKRLKERYGDDSARIVAEMSIPHKVPVFTYRIKEKVEGKRDSVTVKDTFYCFENNERTLQVFDRYGIDTLVMSSLDSIKYSLRFMHASFVALEPQTGYVKAWVGDLDFKTWKHDNVTSLRQPGSTFKLFDYTAAMKAGLCPCDERIDQYVPWEVWDNGKRVTWSPHNADGVFTGRPFSLKAAFARSINTIAVQVSKEVGIPEINKTACEMGIKTLKNKKLRKHFDTIPSTCLGACEVSLLELTNAYCTVINDGVCHEPVLVTKIVDRHGKTVYEAPKTDKKVLDYEIAFLMQDMLKGALTEPEGTTGALWEYIHPVLKDNEFGGKTGTSSNHSDAWFVGVTPNLVAGSWVGGEYRSIHFRTGELGQGSRTALPIFGHFVGYLFKDPLLAKKYAGKFSKPKERISRNYNCKRYYNPVRTFDLDSIGKGGLVDPDEEELLD